jgi:starch synthase
MQRADMKIVILTREYPPHVYGGAGVHVEYLARELARTVDVEVRRFGPAPDDPGGPGRPAVRSFEPWDAISGGASYAAAIRVVSVDLAMASGMEAPSVVHSHTWYANFAGHLAKLLYGVPHVATTHSLEPLRPWKAEQLGTGGHAVSSFCERMGLTEADAVIAVSGAMRDDLLRVYPSIDPHRVEVIHNGIDPDEFRPDLGTDVLRREGVDPDRPTVIFVGRITRQKGIAHLLDAAESFRPDAQLVLVASSADEPEIGREVTGHVRRLRETRGGVVWIDRMVERPELIQLLSRATVFACPSLYEPLGIVNLEAMACGTAVVATRTGGIPEVVEDGVTGWLVPFSAGDARGTPLDPAGFVRGLSERVNDLIDNAERAEAFGRAGRDRVMAKFTWERVAARTLEVYRRVTSSGPLADDGTAGAKETAR